MWDNCVSQADRQLIENGTKQTRSSKRHPLQAWLTPDVAAHTCNTNTHKERQQQLVQRWHKAFLPASNWAVSHVRAARRHNPSVENSLSSRGRAGNIGWRWRSVRLWRTFSYPLHSATSQIIVMHSYQKRHNTSASRVLKTWEAKQPGQHFIDNLRSVLLLYCL